LTVWLWLDRTASILFDATLSTALFLSVVVLFLFACRQPARRLLIVRWSLIASLAMLPLVAMAPLPRVDVLAMIRQANLLPMSSPVQSASDDQMSAEHTAIEGRLHSFITAFRGDYSAWLRRWMPRCLTLIALSLAAVGAAWVLLGFWGVRWLLLHSREPSLATQAVYDSFGAGTFGPKPRPDLRVSSSVQRPVLVGLFHPTILIPSPYDGPETGADVLKLSLLHELAHAEQSDPWFGTIASLAQSVWFFLPQIWWLRSQLIIDQEFIADHAASQQFGTSSSYAASLLAAGSRPTKGGSQERRRLRTRNPSSTEKAGPHSPLFQRMLMLLYCPFLVEQRPPRRWSWSLRMILVVACVASACVSFRWPHADADEPAPNSGAFGRYDAFRVAEFVAAPLVFTPGGRALPYHMPVALPTHFNLRVEVLSSPAYVASIHIAGHALVLDPSIKHTADPSDDPASFAESWHRIRLLREGQRLSLWIDGRKSRTDLDAKATTEWLTFEPGPDRPTAFRDLVLQW
jgi:beta-lactamase regulating signal transducer with metallopeptidase domain